MPKIEILAPAGTFECFRAAVNAGADAIYLGGEKFGARAYAGNFTSDEIIEALKIAHIFDRKIYLTVNTLVKENEIDELVPYMEPLYNAGLDGAIVQDLGVFEILRENFPKLELHASTQMAITGVYGAEYLKKLGACRVVPARELSFSEIKDIKDKTGLDIECFVHGAMCYAYSGQCLFSSVLGGRSGNRGRCAGPCRLPYTDKNGKTLYPLSLKDMYTLPILPELIKAGVYSFKIEGRMKSPEYVAGVTALYRKYVDMYLANPDKPYKIDKKDEELLKGLYIRSDICNGYYKQHNGKSMITLKEPGYSGNSSDVIGNIRDKYITKNITLPVTGYIRIHVNEPSLLTLSCDKTSVSVMGDVAIKAQNRPLDEGEIDKRVKKLGDTCFNLVNLEIDTDSESFMAVKSLNELRRKAVVELESKLLEMAIPTTSKGSRSVILTTENDGNTEKITNKMSVMVTTEKQLRIVNGYQNIFMTYVNADILLYGGKLENILMDDRDYALVLPHIFRKRSYQYLGQYKTFLDSGKFKGVMVRNLEEYEWLCEIGYNGQIYSDYTVYIWNNKALDLYDMLFDTVTLPIELNKKELGFIYNNGKLMQPVYGYIPLMYSANCIFNTLEGCINDTSGKMNLYKITDRYKNIFNINSNCLHCYNILYNTVPLSLHSQMEGIFKRGLRELRLDFSIESEAQTKTMMDFYTSLIIKREIGGECPLADFTNGHYKRGVE